MFDLIVVALILGFFQIVTFAGVAALVRMWAARKQAEIEARITGELAKLVTGEPCQSAAVLLAVGKCVGQEAGRSAKMALLSDLSHAQHAVNGIAIDETVAKIGEAQPGLGAILAGLGKNKAKGLLSNPFVQMAIQGMSGRNGGSQPTGDSVPRRHRE
jgi:hypothetical protein